MTVTRQKKLENELAEIDALLDQQKSQVFCALEGKT